MINNNTNIYRKLHNAPDLIYFRVCVDETDLHIGARDNISSKIEVAAIKYRQIVKDHIKIYPEFLTSHSPITENSDKDIIKEMCRAAKLADVGPMAAVAGAVSQFIGSEFTEYADLIIENGGDIFLKSTKDRIIGIYAGNSPFSNKIALKIPADKTPLGICTSSGTFGHSFSYGCADAVVVVAKNTCLADSLATSIANKIKISSDLEKAVEYAKTFSEVISVTAILGSDIAVWGEFELTAI